MKLCLLMLSWIAAPPQPGPLIGVGGGRTPPPLRAQALDWMRGPDSRVVVLPQALGSRRVGNREVARWKAAGARRVRLLMKLGNARARAAINAADVIWFTGGSQVRLMQRLRAAKVDVLVRERHRAGALVGGFSAGAAILSEVLIGDVPDPAPLIVGALPERRGLGLWPAVIIDQHFVEFGRGHRLLTSVLDHPSRVGVGISEFTAIVVRGGELEVVGSGAVQIYDARRATVTPRKPGEHQAASGVTVHVLRRGMRWRP